MISGNITCSDDQIRVIESFSGTCCVLLLSWLLRIVHILRVSVVAYNLLLLLLLSICYQWLLKSRLDCVSMVRRGRLRLLLYYTRIGLKLMLLLKILMIWNILLLFYLRLRHHARKTAIMLLNRCSHDARRISKNGRLGYLYSLL